MSRPIALFAALGSLAACGPRAADVSSLFSGGSVVDNGGDEITCAPAEGSPFDGYYTLDYLLTYDPRTGTGDDPVEATWEELRERLVTLVSSKLPEMAPSLMRYLELLESRDETQERVWRASALSLTDVPDEDIVQQVPDNCKTMREGRLVPDLTQMVRRRYLVESDVPKLYYLYDYDRFAAMRVERPLQFAYLVTHEWLWDFMDSAWTNRSVNRILQSRSSETMTPDQLRAALRAQGLSSDGSGFLGRAGPEVQRLAQLFEDDPLSDYNRRVIVDVMPDEGRLTLTNGRRRTFEVRIPTNEPRLAHTRGVALMIGHRGRSGSPSVNLAVTRGVAPFVASISPGSGRASQTLFHGLCRDRRCRNREGELAGLFTPDGFAGSRWSFEFEVVGGTADVIVPYLVFVPKRETEP